MTTKRTSRSRPKPRPTPPQAKRKIPVLPLVFGALAALLVAAVLFTGGESQSDADRIAAAAGTPTVTGTPLAVFSDTGPDLSVGSVAPTVVGTDFDGREVTIDPAGTPTAVLFLAHWCPHCQAEVPRVQEWLDATGGVAGVDIIAVTTAYQPARGNWSPQDWLEGEGWSSPVIRDDAESTVYAAYGAGAFPYWVFLAGDGTVVRRSTGETPIAELEQVMTALRDA